MTTIDLKECFYHIPISKDYQYYFGYTWAGSYYVWRVLPFGWTLSPYICNKVIRPVIKYLRLKGARLVAFVDDIITMDIQNLAHQQTNLVKNTLISRGWAISWEKCKLTPEKERIFVGYIIQTMNGQVTLRIPGDRIRKVRKDLYRALTQGTVSAPPLTRISGQLVSMSKCVLPAMLLLRNACHHLATKQSWADRLTLDPSTIRDLEWWLESLQQWNGVHINHKCVEAQLSSDASRTGYRGHLQGHHVAGFWSQSSHVYFLLHVFWVILLFDKINSDATMVT